MFTNRNKASFLAIVTGVLYAVISHWDLMGLYELINYTGPRPGDAYIMLSGALTLPLLLALFLREKSWRLAILYTAGALLATWTPLIYMMVVDPTSNNLWLLVLLVQVVVVLPAAMISAYVGFFLRFLINKVQNA